MWSVFGHANNDHVRFRVDGPTTGWVGIGFTDAPCVAGGSQQCMRDANLVAGIRGFNELSWRLDWRQGLPTGNGEPISFNHGIVIGVAGRVRVTGAPLEPHTSMVFQRKIKAADNFVRLHVDPAKGTTRQTLLYAWGADGQEQLVNHTPDRRGTVEIDWAVEVEECGRGPQVS